jgi:hypothetical protein
MWDIDEIFLQSVVWECIYAVTDSNLQENATTDPNFTYGSTPNLTIVLCRSAPILPGRVWRLGKEESKIL